MACYLEWLRPSKRLQIANKTGFGQVGDGRPMWPADFTGFGNAEIVFYFPGDGNWWLASINTDALTWQNVGKTTGFGNTSHNPTWIGEFRTWAKPKCSLLAGRF